MPATRRGGASPQETRAGARAGLHRAASPFAEAIGPAADALEREANRAADAIALGRRTPVGVGWSAASTGTIQRKCAECLEEEEEQIRRSPKGPVPEPAAREAAMPDAAPAVPAPAPSEAAPFWLVEDEATAAPGQMRKSAFLALLRREICASVDAAMSGTGRDSAGCPWIDHWLGHYAGRSASHVERALRKYAPEAGAAASARDYVPFVAARVRESADRYAATGEISGVPDDVPGGALAGGGLLGVFGGMFFKARPGGARASAERPESVRASLGAGRPLEGDVRSRMESAFGASFSRVRVHTDGTAARLSDRLNAHAFAVGAHVAFGAGTYRPGTPVGDALIAHELAHVVQQGGAERAETGADPRRVSASSALERDADRAAAGAVGGLWGGTRTRPAIRPQLRSGLTLSRCSSGRKPIVLGECPEMSEKDWRTSVTGATDEKAQLALIQGRLCHSTVRLADSKCPTQEFPDDYAPVPTINYDPNLNRKTRYSSTRNCDGSKKKDRSGEERRESGRAGTSLGANFGHSFIATVDTSGETKERKKYVVLGPKVLEKGPLEPKRAAEHELFHAEYHLEDYKTDDDVQEVETYVQDFKKYFARMGSMKRGPQLPDGTQPDIYFGASWQTLEGYYARVKNKDAKALKPYLAQLVDYYNEAAAATKTLMQEWMKRHEDFEVVKDLRTELKLPKQA